MLNKRIFTSQKILVSSSGKNVSVQALVSQFGAKYVFDESEIPMEFLKGKGPELTVMYHEIPVKGVLVKEMNTSGVYFHIRFINPSNLFRHQINIDLKESGLPSPWGRSFARLESEYKNLPAPTIAMVTENSDTKYISIKNFTLGGLLLEHSLSDQIDLKIGTRISFDIVTNHGERLEKIVAEVCNITSESRGEGGDKCFWGVKFISMHPLSAMKYKNLIKEYCIGFRDSEESGKKTG